jgi:hypothetical protein
MYISTGAFPLDFSASRKIRYVKVNIIARFEPKRKRAPYGLSAMGGTILIAT